LHIGKWFTSIMIPYTLPQSGSVVAYDHGANENMIPASSDEQV
jgi:hypothetical protein